MIGDPSIRIFQPQSKGQVSTPSPDAASADRKIEPASATSERTFAQNTTAPTWRTKRQVAAHFQVSPRTITNWTSAGVLPFIWLGAMLRFDERACDDAFERFKSPSVIAIKADGDLFDSPARNWRTKRQMCGHLNCSYRTIGNLMRRKTLPFIGIGSIIRFDLAECDRIVAQFRIPSAFEN
jgi:hypothetical protein